MELNENELEKVLGGANPNVIEKEEKNDELSETELENVHAGMYNQDLAKEMVEQNQDLYRSQMVNQLHEDDQEYFDEHPKTR